MLRRLTPDLVGLLYTLLDVWHDRLLQEVPWAFRDYPCSMAGPIHQILPNSVTSYPLVLGGTVVLRLKRHAVPIFRATDSCVDRVSETHVPYPGTLYFAICYGSGRAEG